MGKEESVSIEGLELDGRPKSEEGWLRITINNKPISYNDATG